MRREDSEADQPGSLLHSMPTYVYRFVDTGETIEVQQPFSADALTEAVHPETGELRPVRKVFTPIGITFKGGGFYKTDSRSSSSRPSKAGSDGASSTSSSGSGASGDSRSSSGSSADSKSSSADSKSSSSSSAE